jgi:hypothetical protein
MFHASPNLNDKVLSCFCLIYLRLQKFLYYYSKYQCTSHQPVSRGTFNVFVFGGGLQPVSPLPSPSLPPPPLDARLFRLNLT